jgi:uncharacterized protein (DUF362 family)
MNNPSLPPSAPESDSPPNRPGRWAPWTRLMFPILSAVALMWFFVRVIPKPIRATYPCQQAAFPLASAFVVWLLAVKAGVSVYCAAHFRRLQRGLAVAWMVFVCVLGLWGATAIAQTILQSWVPSDPPNTPIGVARGIVPGRVAWAYDPQAATWDGKTGNFYDDHATSLPRVEAMLSQTIQSVSDQATDAGAWRALFEHFNTQHGRGVRGYRAGERVAVKINCNNSGNTNLANTSRIDATPQTVTAVLRQLVNVAGVAQSNITVYDAQRYVTRIRHACAPEFPHVRFEDKGTVQWVDNVIKFATNAVKVESGRLPTFVVEADYLVNLAILKRHTELVDPLNWRDGHGQTAVTCCLKNHFGTTGSPSGMHTMIRDWRNGMASYNAVVDLNGSRHLEGKTLLYLVDGLYAGDKHNAKIKKWNMAPFNGRWPSSLFASLDVVAMDSVALDFLRTEWGLMGNADNFLHEAALADHPPSGIRYQPDGVPLKSLGVHEHWNNATDKQYSRNLGRTNGIELVYLGPSQTTASAAR